jgi:hypothetical protein
MIFFTLSFSILQFSFFNSILGVFSNGHHRGNLTRMVDHGPTHERVRPALSSQSV